MDRSSRSGESFSSTFSNECFSPYLDDALISDHPNAHRALPASIADDGRRVTTTIQSAHTSSHEYQRPFSEEGTWLSIDVPLQDSDWPLHRLPSNTSVESSSVSTRRIKAATQRRSEKGISLELSCSENGAKQEIERWIHIHDGNVRLDGLRNMVPPLTNISEEELLLAERLLYDLQAERTHLGRRDRAKVEGFVYRYDGYHDFVDELDTSHHIIFLCVPYFVLCNSHDAQRCGSTSGKPTLDTSPQGLDHTGLQKVQVFPNPTTLETSSVLCTSQMFIILLGNGQ